MHFPATVLGTGVIAAIIVAHLQDSPVATLHQIDPASTVDMMTTGSITAPQQAGPTKAIRLIDLRSGATCKVANPTQLSNRFAPAPVSSACAGSPELGKVSQWRAPSDGTIEMADRSGRTVLRFMPGDGVLYESIYPSDSMVTIVPAKG